ncbi:hypothetical protein [Flavobacterium sp.]|uniref:hypothetical protein n=1 Tax=Flavobacterium sp. TaxID=239 RepID=UPI003D26D4FF
MAGEGSMAGAATSLKNNKALRKVDRSKWKSYTGSNKVATKKLGKISPRKLQELKLLLKRRNRINKMIQISLLILFLIAFIFAIYYLDK